MSTEHGILIVLVSSSVFYYFCFVVRNLPDSFAVHVKLRLLNHIVSCRMSSSVAAINLTTPCH